MLTLALLLFSLSHRAPVNLSGPIPVDRVVINDYSDAQGNPVFTQVILYRWGHYIGGQKRYCVADWAIVKEDQWWTTIRNGRREVSWVEQHTIHIRRVVTDSYDTLPTNYDLEYVDRAILPMEHRKSYLPKIGEQNDDY